MIITFIVVQYFKDAIMKMNQLIIINNIHWNICFNQIQSFEPELRISCPILTKLNRRQKWLDEYN